MDTELPLVVIRACSWGSSTEGNNYWDYYEDNHTDNNDDDSSDDSSKAPASGHTRCIMSSLVIATAPFRVNLHWNIMLCTEGCYFLDILLFVIERPSI